MVVEDEQAGLRSPLDGTHALFDQQDHLGAPFSLPDVLWGQVWDVGRVDEIRLDVGVDAQEDDEDCVETLRVLVSREEGRGA